MPAMISGLARFYADRVPAINQVTVTTRINVGAVPRLLHRESHHHPAVLFIGSRLSEAVKYSTKHLLTRAPVRDPAVSKGSPISNPARGCDGEVTVPLP
jgi:hypothetical protein